MLKFWSLQLHWGALQKISKFLVYLSQDSPGEKLEVWNLEGIPLLVMCSLHRKGKINKNSWEADTAQLSLIFFQFLRKADSNVFGEKAVNNSKHPWQFGLMAYLKILWPKDLNNFEGCSFINEAKMEIRIFSSDSGNFYEAKIS